MNIIRIYELFPTRLSCIKFLEKVRWGSEPRCPYCDSTNTAPSALRHRCYNCWTSFSVTVGTVFHHTHVPLQKWFLAIMLNVKGGISALKLSKELTVNKNTACRISMKIHKAKAQISNRDLIQRIVVLDETHIGGKAVNCTSEVGLMGDE